MRGKAESSGALGAVLPLNLQDNILKYIGLRQSQMPLRTATALEVCRPHDR